MPEVDTGHDGKDGDPSYQIDYTVGGSLLDQGLADLKAGLPAPGLANAADTEAIRRMLGRG